jgi:flagellar hook-associated protein 2
MAVDILSSLNSNGSGLNLRELASGLVMAEIAPLRSAQDARISKAETSISALGQVRSQMQTLSAAMSALAATPILTAASSSPDIGVTVTDPKLISNTTRGIEVVQTAQRQALEFTGFAAADAPIGAGTVLVEYGTWTDDITNGQTFAADGTTGTHTLTIADGATLADLALTLDALEGISASVLDKGDGTFSLGIVSEPGAASALRFTVTETTAGLSAFDTTTTNGTAQIKAAADAEVKIDGITVFRQTNVIDDLIPGTRLDISAAAGSNATLTFGRESATAYDNLDFMVQQINDARSLLNTVSARGLAGAEAGPLAGDRAIERLKTALTTLIAGPLTGFGTASRHLAEFGVATQRDGTLLLDRQRFDAAFAADPAAFDAVFSNRFTTDTAGVEVTGVVGDGVASGDFTYLHDSGTGRASFGGAATLGVALGDGRTRFAVLGGAMAGVLITAPDDVTEAQVTYGRSFISAVNALTRDVLSSAGDLTRRENDINGTTRDATDRLTALDTREAALQTRYLTRFAAMEQAITQLKGTGDYLTNLVAQWNKSG